MILRVSKQLGQHQAEVEQLVRWAIRQVLEPGDCKRLAVNVKSRPPVVTWEVPHPGDPEAILVTSSTRRRLLERMAELQVQGVLPTPVAEYRRRVRHDLYLTGRAYSHLPYPSNWPPGYRRLITMHVPQRLEAMEHPHVDTYVKREPVTTLCWQERVVSVAAHEARHVFQYIYDRQRSEADCQRKARWAVERWRAQEQRKERAG